jgi:hypothetical protein
LLVVVPTGTSTVMVLVLPARQGRHADRHRLPGRPRLSSPSRQRRCPLR